MKTKEIIKLEQPIAYTILENALKNDKLAHAYLFNGEKGTPKMATALLFAKSLLCSYKDGFACEECETCERIQNGNYADLIILNGETNSIKKNEILDLQESLNKTAIEVIGKKIYIINYVENATTEALNSLLKFLEEPTNDLTAILIVEQMDRLLPTIISRCQIIPFRKVNVRECYELCINEKMNPLDAYLLSHLIGNKSEIDEMLENENYQQARILGLQMLEDFIQDKYLALYHLQKDGFKDKKGNEREQFIRFVSILSIFYRDVIKNQTFCTDSTWLKLMSQYDSMQCIQYLSICNEMIDKCNKSVNLNLLVDQLLSQLKEMI